jgi:hypothetical protein
MHRTRRQEINRPRISPVQRMRRRNLRQLRLDRRRQSRVLGDAGKVGLVVGYWADGGRESALGGEGEFYGGGGFVHAHRSQR